MKYILITLFALLYGCAQPAAPVQKKSATPQTRTFFVCGKARHASVAELNGLAWLLPESVVKPCDYALRVIETSPTHPPRRYWLAVDSLTYYAAQRGKAFVYEK